jgi:UDP-galactopyranose mutase
VALHIDHVSVCGDLFLRRSILSGESAVLDRYRYEATQLRNVSFVGRLATFKYLDMDVAIGQAMHAAATMVDCLAGDLPVPAFFRP